MSERVEMAAGFWESSSEAAVREVIPRGAIQVVVNPRAGGGRGRSLATRLTAALRDQGYDPSVFVTQGPGQALAWAEEQHARAGALVCLAGDDTLSEVAGAAMRRRIPLVAVPVGFGNVFARQFGHRADVEAVLSLLRGGEPIAVDVGLQHDAAHDPAAAERVLFLSTASYGFLEAVKQRVESAGRPPQPLLRRLSYMAAATTRLLSDAPLPLVEIRADGQTLTDEGAVVLVSNVPAYPGHLLLTPDADPTDGLFDVCAIATRSRRELGRILLRLRRGEPACAGRVIRRRARTVEVTHHYEGRLLSSVNPRPRRGGQRTETLTLLPRALPVLVPPGSRIGQARASPASPSPATDHTCARRGVA